MWESTGAEISFNTKMRSIVCAVLLLLLSAVTAALQRVSPSVSRRQAVLSHGAAAATAAAAVCAAGPSSAWAAQRGAEDAYKYQAFETSEVCTRRTMLGACAEVGKPTTDKAAAPKLLEVTPEPESDLVKSLLQKTADNKETNARLVKEKTIKADQGATFGPFAKDAPIMRADGTFDIVPLARYDKLKDKGKLTKTKTGLDTYVPGFDPDAPEPQRQKLFGIF